MLVGFGLVVGAVVPPPETVDGEELVADDGSFVGEGTIAPLRVGLGVGDTAGGIDIEKSSAQCEK